MAEEITLIYDLEKCLEDNSCHNNMVRILGKEFVVNNRLECKILVRNKERKLLEYISFNPKKEKELEIKLIEIGKYRRCKSHV